MTARDMFALVDVDTDGWGAAADYRRPERAGNDQVFVHHPGTDLDPDADAGDVEAEKQALRAIEKYAMRNGWWGLAYDIVVGQSGTVYAGRGLARSGATSGDVDDDGTHNNDSGEAVLVLASPDTTMTDACRESLRRLLDAHGGTVIGHKNAGGIVTSCPGRDRLEFIGAYVAGTLDDDSAPTPEPAPYPTPALSWQEEIIDAMDTVNLSDVTNDRRTWVRGEDVRTLQCLLVARQHAPANTIDGDGDVDGIGGPGTKAALGDFQRATGTGKASGAPDYVVGPKTWAALTGQ